MWKTNFETDDIKLENIKGNKQWKKLIKIDITTT